jgi:hypothetical protein
LEVPDLKNEATKLTKKSEKTRFNGPLIGVAGGAGPPGRLEGGDEIPEETSA